MGEGTQRRLEVVIPENQDDETCRTFVLHKEGHTLGNSLRWMVMKNSDVAFCGYSIPHPSEHKINFRIQTNGAEATEVLKRGLSDLSDLCQHLQSTFDAGVEKYKKHERKQRHQEAMEVDNGT